MTPTLFSWGYWGWGNATRQLVQAVDAIEAARGFQPPVFVDVRISRSVRAIGFNGNAFGELLGAKRYWHLSALGNLSVKQPTGERIHIKAPAAAEHLLEFALAAQKNQQRVIFFCSCEFPGTGNRTCHRVSVAKLVLKYARRRDVAAQVVEWPGGTPQRIELQLPTAVFKKLENGGKSLPLSARLPAPELLSLPWGSVVHLNQTLAVVSGPARYSVGQWFLPVLEGPYESVAQTAREGRQWHKDLGMEVHH